MITFDVSDVLPGRNPLPPATIRTAIEEIIHAPVQAGASNVPNLVESVAHGFLGAAHHAFAAHHPLVLSPDDVWLCITQGLAHHVAGNSEVLRDRIVRHRQKIEIVIRRDGFRRGSPENDWPGCFAEFSSKIAEHAGDLQNLVVANFCNCSTNLMFRVVES